jgi:hypothetical protein
MYVFEMRLCSPKAMPCWLSTISEQSHPLGFDLAFLSTDFELDD